LYLPMTIDHQMVLTRRSSRRLSRVPAQDQEFPPVRPDPVSTQFMTCMPGPLISCCLSPNAAVRQLSRILVALRLNQSRSNLLSLKKANSRKTSSRSAKSEEITRVYDIISHIFGRACSTNTELLDGNRWLTSSSCFARSTHNFIIKCYQHLLTEI
jgi:hypothetical protein